MKATAKLMEAARYYVPIPANFNFYLFVLTLVITITLSSTIFNYIDSRHELTIQSIDYNYQINNLQNDIIELEYMLEECNMHTPAKEITDGN